MGVAMQRDIGAYLVVKEAVNPQVVTAGGGADGVEINGTAIDRLAIRYPTLSCKVAIPYYVAGVGSTDTVTVVSNLQHSSLSTAGWADLPNRDGTTISSVVFSGTTAASTGTGTLAYDLEIGGAKRYVRVNVTATLSAAGVDTADIAGIVAFGGQDTLPAA